MKKGNKGTAARVAPKTSTIGYINANGKMVPLSIIRSKFDGVHSKAQALPEGKEKTGLLNAIEGAYLDTVEWFKSFYGAAPVEA